MKSITYQRDGLTVVARERIGRDDIEAVFINAVLARPAAARHNITDIAKLPNRDWALIAAITPLIQQVISLDGEWPFTLPPSDSDEALVAFYNAVLDAPSRYLDALNAAVKEVNMSPLPNASAPTPDSTSISDSGAPSQVAN